MSRVVGRLFVVGVLLVGCAAPPPSSDRVNETIVLTKYAPGVDFGAYATFFLRPEIFTSSADGGIEPLDPEKAATLLAATENNMTGRGYATTAQPETADLGVQMFYMDQVTTQYWCYSWWDPYYWGYPVWGYYPYYGGCDATVWRSGMLATVIVDLKFARDTEAGAGTPGAGGAGGDNDGGLRQVPGLWFSGVYGVSPTTQKARDGINQAFKQSPYLKTSQ